MADIIFPGVQCWDQHRISMFSVALRSAQGTTTRSSTPLCYFSNSESNIIPAEKEKKKPTHTLN